MKNQIKNLPVAQDTPYPLQAHFVFVLTDWKENFCQLELPYEPFSMNRIRIPHGGMHAVLLDTVMGYAGIFTGDANAQRYTVTLNLKCKFTCQKQGKNIFCRRTAHRRGASIFLLKDRSRKIQMSW